jgi:carboxyl-terminal processing protease
LKFKLTRANIKVHDVPYLGVDENGIGYIRVTKFAKHTANDFHKAIIEINKKSLKGIVIDLRGNSGGLLQNALAILDEFTDRKTELLNTKGRTEKSNRHMLARRKKSVSPDIPIVVLINKSSASASEIVSGVLQDLDRAVIIGQKSFGKGLVQSIYTLNDTATLKVTTAKYYTPSGRLIQKQDYLNNGVLTDGFDKKDTVFTTRGGRNVRGGGGITPDIEVKPEKLPPFVQALWRQGIFLNFAATYDKSKVRYNEKVIIDQNILNDFKAFIKEDSLEYKEYGEKYLTLLKETLQKQDDFSDSTQSIVDRVAFWKPKKGSIDYLTQKLDEYYTNKKENPFDTKNNMKWIINGLQREFSRVMCGISTECYDDLTGSKERIRVALFDDNNYQKAVEVLMNANQYYSILSPEQK